jgi:hypothetical protein
MAQLNGHCCVYPLLSGDGALPHHQVEALVGALGGPRHESLHTKQSARRNNGTRGCKLTKGWSLRHALRSSASRAIAMPDIFLLLPLDDKIGPSAATSTERHSPSAARPNQVSTAVPIRYRRRPLDVKRARQMKKENLSLELSKGSRK